MNRFIAALASVAAFSFVSAGMAAAQAPKAPTPPAPAATAPAAPATQAKPATPTAAPTTANIPRAAVTGLQGMQLFEANVSLRSSACGQKGQLWKWVPPHKPGDVGPNGRIYSSFSNGRCDINKEAVRAASR